MPYVPIKLPPYATGDLLLLFEKTIDPIFREVHSLLTVRRDDQGPKGSMQIPTAILLVAAADGAAQFLIPGEKGIGERFVLFFKECYPWDKDPPDGMTTDQAADFLWDKVRCPLFHRFGVIFESKLVHKYGNIFALQEAELEKIEESATRPFSDPSIRQDSVRTVLWLETFYWGIRQAISRAIDTPEKAARIQEWIASGKWDRKSKLSKRT